MEFLPATLAREESDAMARRCQTGIDERGFGLWALEVPGRGDFIGYVGLSVPCFEAAFTPCVEIGWRIARAHWGNGYVTEAAKLTLDFGFTVAAFKEIVSFTVPDNVRSRAVMRRLGMSHRSEDDFDHPAVHPATTSGGTSSTGSALPVRTSKPFTSPDGLAAGYPAPPGPAWWRESGR